MASVSIITTLFKSEKFIDEFYRRTLTVSEEIFDDIENTTGMKITRHRYRTGEEHGTWQVPPKWDIKSAWLSRSA